MFLFSLNRFPLRTPPSSSLKSLSFYQKKTKKKRKVLLLRFGRLPFRFVTLRARRRSSVVVFFRTGDISIRLRPPYYKSGGRSSSRDHRAALAPSLSALAVWTGRCFVRGFRSGVGLYRRRRHETQYQLGQIIKQPRYAI